MECSVVTSSDHTLCEWFAKTPFFEDFASKEIKIFDQYIKMVDNPKGMIIIHEGGEPEALYFVVSGKVDIFKQTPDFKQKKITTIYSGKTFGDISVFDGLAYAVTAIASTDCCMLLLTCEDFKRLEQDHPEICLKLLFKLARLFGLRLRRALDVLVTDAT